MKHQEMERQLAPLVRAMVRRVLATAGRPEEKAEALLRLAHRNRQKALLYEHRSWQALLMQSRRSTLYRDLARLRLRASRFLEACARQVRHEGRKVAAPAEYPFMDYSA